MNAHREHVCDVLVVGSGAAGLSLALRIAEHAKVIVLSKGPRSEGATYYAQGGIHRFIHLYMERFRLFEANRWFKL